MTKESKNETLKEIIVDDTAYRTTLTKKYEQRTAWSPHDSRKIVAFLPGTVKQILVKKGDVVKEGQTLLKFEAMKMVNNVQTSIAGTVKEINIKEGERFSKGFVLIELQ